MVLPLFAGPALKARSCLSASASPAAATTQIAAPAHATGWSGVLLAEAGEQERRGKQQRQQGLRLVEDEEARLCSPRSVQRA